MKEFKNKVKLNELLGVIEDNQHLLIGRSIKIREYVNGTFFRIIFDNNENTKVFDSEGKEYDWSIEHSAMKVKTIPNSWFRDLFGLPERTKTIEVIVKTTDRIKRMLHHYIISQSIQLPMLQKDIVITENGVTTLDEEIEVFRLKRYLKPKTLLQDVILLLNTNKKIVIENMDIQIVIANE